MVIKNDEGDIIPIGDNMVSEQRHITMSHIKGKGTSIELKLRKALWHEGLRYRTNYRKLPGSPDITITRYKIAIFCDSEFWHGKDWRRLRRKLAKGNNPDFWIAKIRRNRQRDRQVDRRLAVMGWTVLHFWEDDIDRRLGQCVGTVIRTKEGKENEHSV